MIRIRVKQFRDPDGDYWAETEDDGVVSVNLALTAELDVPSMAYLMLHEHTHVVTADGGRHGDAFYDNLQCVLESVEWSNWQVARDIEQIYPEWMDV